METAPQLTMPPADGRAAKGAFTLIELLIVIAIIALLTALILPAISMIKASAHITQCSTNLRQQGMAMYAYAQDNRGILMPVWGGNVMSPLHFLVATGYVDLKGYATVNAPVIPAHSMMRCPAGSTAGLCVPTLTGGQVCASPFDQAFSFPGRWSDGGHPVAGASAYYDSWYSWNANNVVRATGISFLCMNAKLAFITMPQTAIFALDGAFPMHLSGQRIGARHRQKMNVLLGDGHVALAAASTLCNLSTWNLLSSTDFRWNY